MGACLSCDDKQSGLRQQATLRYAAPETGSPPALKLEEEAPAQHPASGLIESSDASCEVQLSDDARHGPNIPTSKASSSPSHFMSELQLLQDVQIVGTLGKGKRATSYKGRCTAGMMQSSLHV